MGQSTVLVPTIGATAPGKWIRNPTLADLVAGSFAVPQNPVLQNIAAGLGRLRGCGCAGLGCNEGREFYGLNALGQFENYGLGRLSGLGQTPGTDAVSQFLVTNGGQPGAWLADETTFAGFTMPMWGWLAGGAAVAYVASDLFSKGHAASKRYAARYAQNPHRHRNVAQGYYDGTGFHPIRKSSDYDPDRVGELYQYRPKKKRLAPGYRQRARGGTR
jgi:hypothetical protein